MLKYPLLKPLVTGPADARPVYMVAGLGGHVLQFRPLAGALLPDWQMNGILYPIYAGVPDPHPTIESLSKAMLSAFDDVAGPVVLVGYSMGGAVGYEIACHLRAAGRRTAVVMIDTSVASLRRKYGRLFRGFRNLLLIWPMKLLRIHRTLPDRWEPREAHVKAFVAENRASLRVFTPKPSDIPVVMVRAVPPEKFAWIWGRYWPACDLGWSAVAPVTDLIHCPGAHTTVIQPQYQQGLAKALDIAFRRAYAQCD